MRFGDEVESLVRAFKNVDQGDPACLNSFGELEVSTIVPCI